MNIGRFGARAAALALCACTSLVFSPGCGRGISGYCEDAAVCEGGNEADIEACQIRFETLEERADLTNCNQEFEDWYACLDDASRCNDDRYGVDEDECESEEERVEDCLDD